MPADDLSSLISRVVEAKAEYDVRLLTQQLGTNYRSLMYWMRGERHIPAHLLPQMWSCSTTTKRWISLRVKLDA